MLRAGSWLGTRRATGVAWAMRGSPRGLKGLAHLAAPILSTGILLAACGAPLPPGGPGAGPQAAAQPKRVAAVVMKGDPQVVVEELEGAADTIQELVTGGLGMVDPQGIVHPEAAEPIPSVENGLWKVSPDGRMETTWTIKEGARWQDGTPLTTEDLLFTDRVAQDPELPFRGPAYRSLDRIEARDARTIVAFWKRPYVLADRLFTRMATLPMPKHILQPAYEEGPAALFVEQRYWSDEYVGLGPFKVKEWVRGSHLVLEAYDGYVMGRPKIDAVHIRFITDLNTVVATVLAGDVDVTLGSGLEIEQALQLKNSWRDGNVEIAPAAITAIIPQFAGPNPTVVGNLQFRRALLQAIDRQEMADTIRSGLVPVAHGYLDQSLPERDALNRRLVTYGYDPQQATRLIAGLDYQRGPGEAFGDPGRRNLSVEVRAGSRGDEPQSLQAVAEYWKRIGVEVDTVITQQRGDREYTATFPAFLIRRYTDDPNRVAEFHSSEVPLPDNRFRGRNTPRYSSAELDRLLERFTVTIPRRERMEIFGDILHHLSDQLVLLPLFYNAGVTLISHRMEHVSPRTSTTQTWKAYTWDLK